MPIEYYARSKDGTNVHYRYYYTGNPALMLIHGLTMDIDSWHHQIEHFVRDYSILAFDLRGHGMTDKPKKTESYNLERFVEDVDAVAHAAGVEEFSLAGFSLGGVIAMQYAIENPDRLEKLVTINTPYNPWSIKKSFFPKLAAARAVPKKLIGLGLDDEPVWKYKGRLHTHRKSFMMADQDVVNKLMWAMKGLNIDFSKVDVEHLLIYSSKDEIVKPKPPEGSNSVIVNGGHHYVIAQKPKEINMIMEMFLKRK